MSEKLDRRCGSELIGRVRPLPPGSEIEYMGEYATVVADNGGASLLVDATASDKNGCGRLKVSNALLFRLAPMGRQSL